MTFEDVLDRTFFYDYRGPSGDPSPAEAEIKAALERIFKTGPGKSMIEDFLSAPEKQISFVYKSNDAIVLDENLGLGTVHFDPAFSQNIIYINKKGVAVQELVVGTIAHELVHALYGYTDTEGSGGWINYPDYSGQTVSYANKIFVALGLDPQLSYRAGSPKGSPLVLDRDYAQGERIDRAWNANFREPNHTSSGYARDLLIGNDQVNILSGGDGNDILYGGGSNDTLWGGAGRDKLFGEAGNDELIGGAGNDTLDGGADYDTVFYSDAARRIVVDVKDDDSGTAGFTAQVSGVGSDQLFSIERIVGTAYADLFRVAKGEADLTLDAGEEKDTLAANNASAGVRFNLADKTLTVDGIGMKFDNFESYYGSAHDDTFIISGTFERINGAAGYDTADFSTLDRGIAETDPERLAKIEKLILTGFDDVLVLPDTCREVEGGRGNDILTGNKFNDIIKGDDNDDVLHGGGGIDRIFGGADRDLLFGEAGKDVLDGGTGNDELTGGTGVDRFIFGSDGNLAFGRDVIFDFNGAGGERIDLSAFGAIAEVHAVEHSGDVSVTTANGFDIEWTRYSSGIHVSSQSDPSLSGHIEFARDVPISIDYIIFG